MQDSTQVTFVYTAAAAGPGPIKELVAAGDHDAGRRFAFYDRLEVHRLDSGAEPSPGILYVADSSVSSRHCVITQDRDGRCFVRDTSLNGTKIDNHRLMPGAEVEIKVGQTLSVGQGHDFRLVGGVVTASRAQRERTILVSQPVEVTVLVGDICHYTSLVSETRADQLQSSVTAVFRRLDQLVMELDGTVKEHPGDAILAYWEASGSENSAVRACRAALALESEARRLASDGSIWGLADRPLRMDWGLSSGKVTVQSHGGPHPVGLSVVGVPVIKAFLVEKLANDATGNVLTCAATRTLAGDRFRFRALGPMRLSGLGSSEEVFALLDVP